MAQASLVPGVQLSIPRMAVRTYSDPGPGTPIRTQTSAMLLRASPSLHLQYRLSQLWNPFLLLLCYKGKISFPLLWKKVNQQEASTLLAAAFCKRKNDTLSPGRIVQTYLRESHLTCIKQLYLPENFWPFGSNQKYSSKFFLPMKRHI